jgi:hypothetical protein
MRGSVVKRISSHHDLHEYMTSLSAALKERGLRDMSDTIDFAVAQASMVTTEFPGESRIALRHILKVENGTLTGEERVTMADVLRQIDEWFDSR